MELFLNYEAYKTVEDKFIRLGQANEKWAEENREEINKVLNNNQGNWVQSFNISTDDIYKLFLVYSDKVSKTNQTFSEADYYVYYIFNVCWMMPYTLNWGVIYEIGGRTLNDGVAEDIMYNSEHHDTIYDRCNDIDSVTAVEKSTVEEIKNLAGKLTHVDKSFLNDDFDIMEEGFKKQGYIMDFLDVFTDFVNKVNDFNTEIASKFSDVVGTFSDFPLFQRDTDYKAYVDSHYSQINVVDIKDSPLYDAEGSYGGNQGDPLYNQTGFTFFGIDIGYNKELYAFVRSHPGYENYTNEQIEELFKEYNERGCSYVAACNVILQEYVDKPEEFKEKYGFDLYDEDGELNYNKLFIDYCIFSDDVIFSDNSKGEEAYVYSVYWYYKDKPEEFEKKYKVPLCDKNDCLSKEANDALVAEYKEKSKNGGTVEVPFDFTGVPNQENRYEAYLEAHGDKASYECTKDTKDLDMEKYRELTEQGYSVAVNCYNFTLYQEDGSIAKDRIDAGHQMVVTGVTGDGRVIVSSWGKEYYVKPEDIAEVVTYKVN